ncbi:anti-phage dCTP deaminase [Acetobacter sp. P5B1]|uniref:anti-phage dCTP deaminase n=1 Tax=Acetobacter sp. P5B1 TaxID=2762620 RepID=UPI001C044972|nr:anti-phage dCTP deaminase [Acetobacter sp. P5B1]
MSDEEKFQPLQLVRDDKSNVLIVGVVGAVGSGTSWVAKVIKNYLESQNKNCVIIKASDLIRDYINDKDKKRIEKEESPFGKVKIYQELGDELRKNNDNSFISAAFISKIASHTNIDLEKTVFILDSLKNPSEVQLLRMVYGDSFWLIGNVCAPETRKERLLKKFKIENKGNERELNEFISRDEDDRSAKYGQHVSSTFERADYFINTSEHLASPDVPFGEIKDWTPYSDITRFVDLITLSRPMLRPTDAEQGMYSAYAARLGSACLSRQVGATLMNDKGEILSTGCNEVPRAGGGLYGQSNNEKDTDKTINSGRCYIFNGICKNTEEKNKIVEYIYNIIKENIRDYSANLEDSAVEKISIGIKKEIQKSKIGDLIEFSRSVHAEMDALISAGRKGASTDGCKLFVTTFPCHNCARHIVAAGIKEVQFIEPYLKSKALDLHCDSITQNPKDQITMGKVLFKPYEGGGFEKPLGSELFCVIPFFWR